MHYWYLLKEEAGFLLHPHIRDNIPAKNTKITELDTGTG